MNIDAAVARLTRLLAQMAEQSQAALAAGRKGNEKKTRRAVDALRLLHAKRGVMDQEVRSRIERLPVRQQDQIRLDLSKIQSAKIFVQTWSKRYQGIAKVEELTLSAEGRNAILDYTLPLDWNFQGDLFVLLGKEELVFAPELYERGQKRILMVGPVSEIESQIYINVIKAHDVLALREYFMRLDSPMPLRLAFLNAQAQDQESQTWIDVKNAFATAIRDFQTSKVLGNAWMTQGLANLRSVALSTNLAALKG
jgi:hypothetical protein